MAWIENNEPAYRAVYNTLSEPEKQHVRSIGFNWNAPAAAAAPAHAPLNPNAAPFETEAERAQMITNLALSGSRLANWTNKPRNEMMANLAASGSKLPTWTGRGRKTRRRTTRRRRRR